MVMSTNQELYTPHYGNEQLQRCAVRIMLTLRQYFMTRNRKLTLLQIDMSLQFIINIPISLIYVRRLDESCRKSNPLDGAVQMQRRR